MWGTFSKLDLSNIVCNENFCHFYLKVPENLNFSHFVISKICIIWSNALNGHWKFNFVNKWSVVVKPVHLHRESEQQLVVWQVLRWSLASRRRIRLNFDSSRRATPPEVRTRLSEWLRKTGGQPLWPFMFEIDTIFNWETIKLQVNSIFC